jgi:hypothetical protein
MRMILGFFQKIVHKRFLCAILPYLRSNLLVSMRLDQILIRSLWLGHRSLEVHAIHTNTKYIHLWCEGDAMGHLHNIPLTRV